MTSVGDGLSSRAARGAGITASVQVARLVVQLAGLVILSRLLRPEDFGLVAMSTAVVGIADVLRDFGLSAAAIQARVLTRGQASNLFWLNTAGGVILAGLVIGVAPVLGALYDDQRVTLVTFALSATFALNGVQAQWQAHLVRQMRYATVSLTDLFAQLAALCLAILAAISGFSFWAIVIQLISAPTILLVSRAALSRWWPGLPDRRASVREFVRYGSGVIGTQLTVYVSSNVDSVVIGASFGAGPLGLYNRAYQALVLPLSQFLAPMTQVALPVLSRLQDDRQRFQAYFDRAHLLVTYASGAGYAAAIGASASLIPLILGPAWAPSVIYFQILAVGGILQAANYSSYWVYLALAKTTTHFRYSLISRTLLVGAILIGALFGPVGVAMGYTAAMALTFPFSMFWLKRTTGVRVGQISKQTLRSTGLALLSAAAGLAAPQFLPSSMVTELAISLAASLLSYAAVMFTVPPLRRDLRNILNTAARFRKVRHIEGNA